MTSYKIIDITLLVILLVLSFSIPYQQYWDGADRDQFTIENYHVFSETQIFNYENFTFYVQDHTFLRGYIDALTIEIDYNLQSNIVEHNNSTLQMIPLQIKFVYDNGNQWLNFFPYQNRNHTSRDVVDVDLLNRTNVEEYQLETIYSLSSLPSQIDSVVFFEFTYQLRDDAGSSLRNYTVTPERSQTYLRYQKGTISPILEFVNVIMVVLVFILLFLPDLSFYIPFGIPFPLRFLFRINIPKILPGILLVENLTDPLDIYLLPLILFNFFMLTGDLLVSIKNYGDFSNDQTDRKITSNDMDKATEYLDLFRLSPFIYLSVFFVIWLFTNYLVPFFGILYILYLDYSVNDNPDTFSTEAYIE